MDSIQLEYSIDLSKILKSNYKKQSRLSDRDLMLAHIEKKYGVLVQEVKEKEEVSYMISLPGRQRKKDGKTFIVGKYSHEHMMRNFARYLNQGRLSKRNVDQTISEMKYLQNFCL